MWSSSLIKVSLCSTWLYCLLGSCKTSCCLWALWMKQSQAFTTMVSLINIIPSKTWHRSGLFASGRFQLSHMPISHNENMSTEVYKSVLYGLHWLTSLYHVNGSNLGVFKEKKDRFFFSEDSMLNLIFAVALGSHCLAENLIEVFEKKRLRAKVLSSVWAASSQPLLHFGIP